MTRVALVHNLNRGESQRDTEYDSAETVDMLHSIIAEKNECRSIEAIQDMTWIPRLIDYAPDIVFNTAEGFHGSAREAVYPAIFEQLGLAYCGPDPTNLTVTLNKHLTKQLVQGIPGLHIPESHLWSEQLDVRALDASRYMLKLMHEGSSIGMQLAENHAEVLEFARQLQADYGANFIVEEFVDGTDISMAYIEGIGVAGPAGVSLPDGTFYNYDLKSIRDREVTISTHPVTQAQKTRLLSVAQAIVRRLDLKGYAKMDMRLQDDTVHFIEVNSQVSFHPEGEFAHCCAADGYNIDDIVHTIINSGLHTNRLASVGVRP